MHTSSVVLPRQALYTNRCTQLMFGWGVTSVGEINCRLQFATRSSSNKFNVASTVISVANMFLTQVCQYRSRMVNKFIGRTVLVKDGNVDGALRVLNRIMGSEGLFDIYRRTRTYEKPFNTRRRVSWQMCKAIYDEDMERKIKFVSRKNRIDPSPAYIL